MAAAPGSERSDARVLGLEVDDETAASALSAYLRPRTVRLILDNVEHLPAAGPLLVELLGADPGLTVLATSRSLLRVSGEQRIPVPPLALPDAGPLPPAATLDRFGAVRLFVDRARAAAPAFAVDDRNAGDVVEICRRLDGLPLAIELAAARITMFPPRALLARLRRRLELLTDGAHDQPERLRSLRAGIARPTWTTFEPRCPGHWKRPTPKTQTRVCSWWERSGTSGSSGA